MATLSTLQVKQENQSYNDSKLEFESYPKENLPEQSSFNPIALNEDFEGELLVVILVDISSVLIEQEVQYNDISTISFEGSPKFDYAIPVFRMF